MKLPYNFFSFPHISYNQMKYVPNKHIKQLFISLKLNLKQKQLLKMFSRINWKPLNYIISCNKTENTLAQCSLH